MVEFPKNDLHPVISLIFIRFAIPKYALTLYNTTLAALPKIRMSVSSSEDFFLQPQSRRFPAAAASILTNQFLPGLGMPSQWYFPNFLMSLYCLRWDISPILFTNSRNTVYGSLHLILFRRLLTIFSGILWIFFLTLFLQLSSDFL